MKKQFVSALMALCLMLTVLPGSALAGQERFSSVEELADWLFSEQACMLAEEIEFGYMQSMDDLLAGEDFPWNMLFSCGIGDMVVSIDDIHREITIYDITYYPGFKAAQAWKIGRTDILNEEERAILAQAEAIVGEACLYAQSPYQVLVNLHEALIERCTFTEGAEEFESHDTAIGALLYGEAECDGYADAFYLLCTLANFPVRFVCGDAGSENRAESGMHMWNLIWMETGWYHMDVSWDDLDFDKDPSMATYRYFLMGSSEMNIHHWDEELLADPPAPYTDWNNTYYNADGTGITYGAYYVTPEEAANYMAYMQREYSQKMMHVLISGNYEGQTAQINEVIQKAGLQGNWWTWAHRCGDYSCISVCIE